MSKDKCETKACRINAEVNYLGIPLCSKCKNEVQAHRWDGALPTKAAMQFRCDHPTEYKTGRTQKEN